MDKFLFIFLIVFWVIKTSSTYAEELDKTRSIIIAPASETQFRYMVSLQKLSEIQTHNRGHRCGGVLVTLQHALTAGRCIIKYDDNIQQIVPIDRDEYRVFGGSVCLTNDTSADRVRRIANTIVHPEYNSTFSWSPNNIGVIILGSPFLSTTVASISRDIAISNTSITPCIGMGWQSGAHLMYKSMAAYDETTCRGLLVKTPNTMCALPMPMNSGCTGDQGSPLVCHDSLVGVLIDTYGCSHDVSRAQMFIRLSNYATWIDIVVALPIPELGPESSTVPSPSVPGASFTFQPGMTLLAVILFVLIIRVSV